MEENERKERVMDKERNRSKKGREELNEEEYGE